MVHACEVANEAEKAIAIRRASGFNKLFEAALKKECERSDLGGANQQGSGQLKGKEREQSEVSKIVELTKRLLQENSMASSKWTWGVDLNENDLRELIWGADRQDQLPHSGYDQDLPSNSLLSQTSEVLDPANLEDPNDGGLIFDTISNLVIPELRPHEFLTFPTVLLGPSGNELADSEPDPIIEAFSKGLKRKTKANKLIMQDEVDRPTSYLDYGSEFISQHALIPRRPWLLPCLPIILPPSHMDDDKAVLDSDDIPDHIDIPDSDDIPGHIDIPDSDDIPGHIDISDSDEIPGHIDIPESDQIPLPDSADIDHLSISDSDSQHSSQINFPVSEDEGSAMDVVDSNEEEMAMSVQYTDLGLESDDIIFPESPMATVKGSGVTIAVERDPNTGRFTAASFANFPDTYLD